MITEIYVHGNGMVKSIKSDDGLIRHYKHVKRAFSDWWVLTDGLSAPNDTKRRGEYSHKVRRGEIK